MVTTISARRTARSTRVTMSSTTNSWGPTPPQPISSGSGRQCSSRSRSSISWALHPVTISPSSRPFIVGWHPERLRVKFALAHSLRSVIFSFGAHFFIDRTLSRWTAARHSCSERSVHLGRPDMPPQYSESDTREVTIPITELNKDQPVFVTLRYPKSINDIEVMENVLDFAAHRLRQNPNILENFVESRT